MMTAQKSVLHTSTRLMSEFSVFFSFGWILLALMPHSHSNLFFALAVFAGSLWPLSSRGAIIRGPYLQVRTTTNVVVRWRTDLLEDSQVNFGTDPANLSLASTNSETTIEHIILVSGLQPETKYYYSIGNSSEVPVGNTNFFFVTAPPGFSIPGRDEPI